MVENIVDPVKKIVELDKTAVNAENINLSAIGNMFLFHYDPKTKQTLPYYDTFPLILLLDVTHTGIFGINMHYLPLNARAMLLNRFYKYVQNDTEYVNIDYNMIKDGGGNIKYAKPCLKRYLSQHIQSRLIPIPIEDWNMMILAPLEQFKKADTSTVWRDSLKMANK